MKTKQSETNTQSETMSNQEIVSVQVAQETQTKAVEALSHNASLQVINELVDYKFISNGLIETTLLLSKGTVYFVSPSGEWLVLGKMADQGVQLNGSMATSELGAKLASVANKTWSRNHIAHAQKLKEEQREAARNKLTTFLGTQPKVNPFA